MKTLKKLHVSACAMALLIFIPNIAANGQDADDESIRVRAWLNKGETRVIDGYLRSTIVNRPDNVEISLTPKGERTRYINEDVDSLLLEGTDKYVKRLIKVPGVFGGKAKVEWVKEDYCGRGIDLYSLFTVESEKINHTTTISAVRGWYLSIAGDVAILVGTSLFRNVFDEDEPPMSKSMLEQYFGKFYDYPEFAARIKAGEFESFMDMVHAWETAYAGTADNDADTTGAGTADNEADTAGNGTADGSTITVRRVDGKFKTEQIGVQNSIAASDAAKNVDWKRTKFEIVFPKYTRTIQVGVSPVIAPWSQVMKHATEGSKSSFKMSVPPIILYSDICFLDFGRFGSIGWTIGGEYSRYGYNWMLDDGYGEKQQDTFCNRVDLAAGLSYHITLCRNLELYARGMLDVGLIGEHTTDHESGEKASTAFNKMDTKISFVAVGGLRWYFCRIAGLWVEGGHDTGYVSTGLSFRF